MRSLTATVLTAAALSICALPGCATSGMETARAGEVARVEEGTLISARAVMVEGSKSWLGPAVGAVLGGLAGSEIGQGDKAQTAGAVVGATAGGYAGSKVQDQMTRKPGYAYTVKLKKTGELITVVQPDTVAISNGTHVLVEYGAHPRVIPTR